PLACPGKLRVTTHPVHVLILLCPTLLSTRTLCKIELTDLTRSTTHQLNETSRIELAIHLRALDDISDLTAKPSSTIILSLLGGTPLRSSPVHDRLSNAKPMSTGLVTDLTDLAPVDQLPDLVPKQVIKL